MSSFMPSRKPSSLNETLPVGDVELECGCKGPLELRASSPTPVADAQPLGWECPKGHFLIVGVSRERTDGNRYFF